MTLESKQPEGRRELRQLNTSYDSEAAKFDLKNKTKQNRDSWVALSVKNPALDFGSGHDLTVREFKLHIRLHATSVEPAWGLFFLSLSPPAPPLLSHTK